MKKSISLFMAVLLLLSSLPALAASHNDKNTVKQVQNALNEAGYDCGTADGVAGKRTVSAIKQYQTDRRLDPTGVIDDALLVSMGLLENSAADKGATGSSGDGTEEAPQAGQGGAKSTVSFGHYEQDNHASNGAEPIEWIVLDRQDGKALLLSRYALDAMPYNTDSVDVTWETCSLRSWLNDIFLNAAFTAEEQKAIQITDVDNSTSQCHEGTIGCSDTRDRVFLLSYREAWTYFGSDEERMCAPTDYAIIRGGNWTQKYLPEGNGTCDWWLRSPGESPRFASRVACDGSGDMGYGLTFIGMGVADGNLCIRPAIWVDMDSEYFTAGQNVKGTAEPAADQAADTNFTDLLTKGRWMIDKQNAVLFFSDGTASVYNLYDGTWHLGSEEDTIILEYSYFSTDITWTLLLGREEDQYILSDAGQGVVLTMDPFDPDEYAEFVGTWVNTDNTLKMILYEDGKAVFTDASQNQCEYVWCIKHDGPYNSGLYLNRYNKEIKGRRELDTVNLHTSEQDFVFIKAESAEAPLGAQDDDPSTAFLTAPAITEALAGQWRGTFTSEGAGGKGEFTIDVLPSGIGRITILDNGSAIILMCLFQESGGLLVAIPENSTGLDSITATNTVNNGKMNIVMTLHYTKGGSRKITLDCEKQSRQ